MAEQIKFSVVVPAYNVEKDLPALLQNLLEQTYNSFEVIVVDDCATDETGKVADSYLQAFRGKQVDYVVIHKPQNEGLSMARNTGISHAAGDYILFWMRMIRWKRICCKGFPMHCKSNVLIWCCMVIPRITMKRDSFPIR